MLLLELFENHDEKVLKIIMSAAHGTGNEQSNLINPSVSYALARWPKAVYRGPLFRAISFGAEEFFNFKSNEDVLRHIRSFKPDGGRHYNSFSKNIQGVGDFVSMSRSFEGDTYSGHNKDSILIITIIQQNGIGIDYQGVAQQFKDDHDYSSSPGAQVGEVLAALDKSADIKMYHVVGLGKRAYTDDEVSANWDDAKEFAEPFSGDPKDKAAHDAREKAESTAHDKGQHMEQDFYFRSDQFQQMQALLRQQYERGTGRSHRPKAPHRKSQMKQYHGGTELRSDYQDYDEDD